MRKKLKSAIFVLHVCILVTSPRIMNRIVELLHLLSNSLTIRINNARHYRTTQEKCTVIGSNNYEVGKWDTSLCSKNTSYICELKKQQTIADYCVDQEGPNEKGFCDVSVRRACLFVSSTDFGSKISWKLDN